MTKGKLRELAKDVFGYIHADDDSVYNGFGANQGFVILEESVLLFDSGFSTVQARELDLGIGKNTDKKVRYLVNSHDHSDHVFGNSYFSKKYSRSGLVIISQEDCSSNLKKKGKSRLRRYRNQDLKLNYMLRQVEIRPPDNTYSDSLIDLNIEGTQLSLIHPPTGAHTHGDTLLALPGKRAFFFGDILWNKFFPNLEDANLDGWIDTLENIDFETYRIFLPGHGDTAQKAEVIHFKNYLKEVQNRLLKLTEEEKRSRELRKCFALEGTESWKFKLAIDRNIKALFGNQSLP